MSKVFQYKNLWVLFHTLVWRHMTYGIKIQFCAADTVSEGVIELEKKVIRAMNSLPFNAHTGRLF